jgi:hypothetical protein
VRAFAYPTITSGLAAALSVLFFLGLASRFGDAMLGQIILLQTAVALVQIAFIPNCLVYLLGAPDGADVDARYREGLSLEWAGTLAGLVVVALAQTLAGPAGEGAVLLYLSLAIQASAATMGVARVRDQWRRYMLWILLPNLLRVPLVWAWPWVMTALGRDGTDASRSTIILLCFLVPDIVRFAAIYLPTALRHFRWPGATAVRTAARQIYRNWFFDVGSAATDQADKLFVGGLFGPQVLVAYFFARRIGVVTVMVTEPFFMELYRRRETGASQLGAGAIWARGIGFAVAIWAGMALAIVLAIQIPLLARFVPEAVVTLLPMFIAVMLLDGLFAANRWSRFLAQMLARAVQLFGLRLFAFALFALVAWLAAPAMPVWGVVTAMASALLVEALYVRALVVRAEMA